MTSVNVKTVTRRCFLSMTKKCSRCGTLFVCSKSRIKDSFYHSSSFFNFQHSYIRTLATWISSYKNIYEIHPFSASVYHYEAVGTIRLKSIHVLPNRSYSAKNVTIRSKKLKTVENSTCDGTTINKTSKMKKEKGYMFIDKGIAGDVAAAIINSRRYKDGIIIENSPGHGILTEAILKYSSNIEKYIAVEANEDFIQFLEKNLQKKNYGRNFIVKKGIRLSNSQSRQKMDKYDEIEKDILETNVGVNGRRTVTFIGPMLEPFEYTLNHLIHKLADKKGYINNFRPEYFYFVSPYMCRKLRNTTLTHPQKMWYNASAVMVHQLFDYSFVAKMPLSSLRFSRKNKKFVELKCPDEVITADLGYLLHLVPRIHVIQELDNVNSFYKFLQQTLSSSSKKSNRLIPKMCELFPDSGIHLIRLGITMMDRSVDISPQQFLQIYKEMKTWPGYEDSALCSVITEDYSTEKIGSDQPSSQVDITNGH